MTVTRDSMALAQLKYCDLPTSTNNVQSLVCWMTSEDTTAEWNPEATERGEPDDSNFNPQGVKNYPNIEEGLKGYKDTLFNGAYTPIIESLKASNPPAETCSHIVNSAWGSKPTPTIVAEVLTHWDECANVPIGGSTVNTTPPPIDPPTTVPSVPVSQLLKETDIMDAVVYNGVLTIVGASPEGHPLVFSLPANGEPTCVDATDAVAATPAAAGKLYTVAV